ncbi:MAG TPA: NAD(P)/FAD-dependent oxidoreductase [Acidimicrobiia bacterium]|nr:NAD(P)/FAD-dependent oxidoreductase [Acidimicrobiia bacterium]
MSDQLPTVVDVVVIGAGHNGLVAAGYLAKVGLRVAVVEAAETPGGMTASGPLIADAPGHIINSCAVDIISMLHSRIPAELELREHGLQIVKADPGYVSLHPDGSSLALWRDHARTAAEIERYSRADARAFLEFTDLLNVLIGAVLPVLGVDFGRPDPKALWASAKVAAKHRSRLGDIAALLTGSATAAAEERFEHPVTLGALVNIAAGAGPVDVPGSGLGFLLLALIGRVGVGRPIGGMQSLTDALVRSLRAKGGTLTTGAPVQEILHAGKRVRGVRLEDGRVIEARSVVATCDPWITLRELVSDDVVDRRTAARLDFTPANGTGAGVFKIDMALNAHIAALQHDRSDVDMRMPTLMLGTEESVRDSYAAAARGDLPDDPNVWVVSPSGMDPTQAPEGQESLYIYSLAAPVHPRDGWDTQRAPAVDSILAKVGKYIGPLEEAELGRLVETPEDLGARLRVRNGCVTHIDMGLLRSGPLRPTIGLGTGKTPLDGLVLGGSGMHPGGGVTGLPGRTAATRTERYLKKRG